MTSPLLTAKSIHFDVGERVLFDQLSFSINEGDRLSLVGCNGTGKSTLMKILCGDIVPTEGEIIRRNGLKIGYVEQVLEDSFKHRQALELVADMLPDEERDYQEYKAEILLEDLGISREKFDVPVSKLSGGQINLIMIARAVIKEPELLFLDEPTNHLDIESLLLVENFLNNYFKKSFLLISHDSEFLDNVTNKTLFLQNEKIYRFSLPYSEAKQEVRKLEEELKKRRDEENREIKRLEVSAKRLSTWGKVYDNEDLARRAKSMEKKIEKLKEQKTEIFKSTQYKLRIDTNITKSNVLLRVEDYDVKIPQINKRLYSVDSFYIKRGDRVVLLGANGCGKTTFIKEIVDNYKSSKDEPNIYFNPQVKLGYYDQEQEQLNPNKGILNEVRSKVFCADDEIKRELILSGFKYGDLDKPISALSGGEKARILFIILKLNKPNFIILDEPTNHIDIYGREELIGNLIESNSTILVTTHDRGFSKIIGTRYFLIKNYEIIEIYNPDKFYVENLKKLRATEKKNTHVKNSTEIQDNDIGEDDKILSEIIQLEEKLEHNLNQTKKHQKPHLQEKWKSRIDFLYNKLS